MFLQTETRNTVAVEEVKEQGENNSTPEGRTETFMKATSLRHRHTMQSKNQKLIKR